MRHARRDYDRIQDPAGLIPEDEPVFLLRGKDLAAPDTVHFWADRALSLGADEEMAASAHNHAAAMLAWQEERGWKVPNMPAEGADAVADALEAARADRAAIVAWLRRPVDKDEARGWLERWMLPTDGLERRFNGGDECWTTSGQGIVAYSAAISEERRGLAAAIERGEHMPGNGGASNG
jgi:hypothetical protein